MKVLVCGGRDYKDKRKVWQRLNKFVATDHLFIIEGGAKGADTLAAEYAQENGIPVATVRANWEFYGKRAGSLRNEWMLDLEPDLVIAFHSDIKNSNGTKHCIYKAGERDIPTELIK